MPTQRVPFIFIFSAPAPGTPLQQLHARWLMFLGKLSCLLLFCLLLLWHLSGTYFFSLVYRNMCVKPQTLCLIEESILWPAWINLPCISYPLNISGSSVEFHDCVYYYLLLTVYVLPIRLYMSYPTYHQMGCSLRAEPVFFFFFLKIEIYFSLMRHPKQMLLIGGWFSSKWCSGSFHLLALSRCSFQGRMLKD